MLFTSGYTDRMIACHRTMESGITILRKPINREDLARRVEEVLAEVADKGRPRENDRLPREEVGDPSGYVARNLRFPRPCQEQVFSIERSP